LSTWQLPDGFGAVELFEARLKDHEDRGRFLDLGKGLATIGRLGYDLKPEAVC
jgi:hypothetical protein